MSKSRSTYAHGGVKMALERISGVGASYQMNNNIRQVEIPDAQVNGDSAAEKDLQDAAGYDMVSLLSGSDEEEKKESTDETVGQDLNDIKKLMSNTECKFGIDDTTNRITIKIIDKDTKKIIKEVPPEKTLKMIAKVWEMAGMLVDEKL